MDYPSGVRGARQSLAIAFASFTAFIALLWVIPKNPGGGFWLFTLPAALLFPYFSYKVISPGTKERTTADAGVMAAALVILYLGGMMISSLTLEGKGLSSAAETMRSMTVTWRRYAFGALLVVSVLKFVDSSPSQSAPLESPPDPTSDPRSSLKESAPASTRPSIQSTDDNSADTVGPGSLAPAHAEHPPMPNRAPLRPTTDMRDASLLSPAPLKRPTHPHSIAGPCPQANDTESTSTPELVPMARTFEKTAEVSGASFTVLRTLVEVATSLSDPSSATSLLISATPTGLELNASGTDVGSVAGNWVGPDPLRVRLSAHEALEALSGLSPSPETLSVRIRWGDKTAVEFCDDKSLRRFALSAVSE